MREYCLSKDLLELYALNGVRNPKRLRRIETHVSNCRRCQVIINRWRTFYNDASSIAKDNVEMVTSQVLLDIQESTHHSHAGSPGMIIKLYPIDIQKPKMRRYMLAAEGQKKQRFEIVQRYVDQKAEILARVMKDNNTNELTLYLIKAGEKCFSDQMLEIEGMGRKFFPDLEGQVRISGIRPEQLVHRKLRLKSPLVSFNLEPLHGMNERILRNQIYEVHGTDDERIKIEVELSAIKKYLNLRITNMISDTNMGNFHVEVSQKGEMRMIARTRRGIAVFERLDIEKNITIRIYL